MRKFLLTFSAIALVCIFGTTAVHANDDGQVVGTLVGAGLGGLAGNQFGHGAGRVATTTAGVFIGGAIGNDIGRSADRSYPPAVYATAPAYTYPTGPVYFQTTYVPNYVAPPTPPPEAYFATAAPYYDEDASGYCREFTQDVRVDDHVEESYGTACLQPDGSWHIEQ
jgi:surface antigen